MSQVKLNSRLIESFGELEQLCNQIYGGPHGVTQYINHMEEVEYAGRSSVPNWDGLYRALKAARHKRNLLSHGEVSFDDNCAQEDDINFLIALRYSILNRSDPISIVTKRTRPQKNQATRNTSMSGGFSDERGGCSGEVLKGFLYVLIFIGIVVGIMAAIFSLTGKSFDNRELNSGFYLTNETADGFTPYLWLDTQASTFRIGASPTHSYSIGGNYVLEGDTLFATIDGDLCCIFKIKSSNKLIISEISDELPAQITEGSKFVFTRLNY